MHQKMIHLDCTFRDGGYYTKWDFSTDLINEYLEAVSAAGVDVAELGFRFWSNNDFRGACAYTTDEFLESLNIPSGISIGLMFNASDLIVDGNVSIARLKKLVPRRADESPADLIRIASHAHEFEATLEACRWLKEQGYRVGANIMQIGQHSKQKIKNFGLKASQSSLDVLYFADSLGSIKPSDVALIISWLRTHWSGAIGMHSHDNLSLALPNSMRALDEGATWIDSTLTGMGRGPGNLRTEEFILEATKIKNLENDLLPLLKLIKEVFMPLKAKHGWGTNPFYYMAGQHSIHPTYIQEMLRDKQYDDEDILSVIDHLKSINGASFDAGTLNSAKNFYKGEGQGSWSPLTELKDKSVLLVGPGDSVNQYDAAINDYIARESPLVIEINAANKIDPSHINYRVACHPVRLLADANKHMDLPQPLITPMSMLPNRLKVILERKSIRDFGIEIREGTFEFHEKSCVIPNSNVIAYALSVAYCGEAKEIFLVGFDGYPDGGARNNEMDKIFSLFISATNASIYSLTPSIYKIPHKSIFAI